MRGGGTVNADGFGVGWYPPAPVPTRPVRYRSDRPLWADPAFAALAAVTSAAGGARRGALGDTVGMPVTATAAAPFAEGRWLFSHNGVVRGLAGAGGGARRRAAGPDLLTLDAPTDSALLWALVRHRLRAGADPAAVWSTSCARRRRRRPRVPAEPAAHRRHRDLGHHLDARAVGRAGRRARSRSRPSRSTPSPGWAGRCRTGTCVGRRPPRGCEAALDAGDPAVRTATPHERARGGIAWPPEPPARRPPHPGDARAALRADVLPGLTSRPKQLPPKYFYDARGSALFEEITALPEYFPTRTEAALLAAHVDEIAALTGATTLVELGSGSSAKTRLLLDALTGAGTLGRYVPLDVSVAALREALDALAASYPALVLHGVVGDFTAHLDRLPREGHGARRDHGSAARRVPRRHDRQPRPGAAGRVPRPGCGPRCGRVSTCCSVRRWSRTRPCSWPPTTTPRG